MNRWLMLSNLSSNMQKIRMAIIERLAKMSPRSFVLIMTVFFEIYFLYLEIMAIIKTGVSNTFWWIPLFVKIGLGYLTYKFYISNNKKLAVLGAVLTIIIIATTLTVYFASRENLAPILGGHLIFLITVNTLFLYRYYSHPGVIKLKPSRYYILIVIGMILMLYYSVSRLIPQIFLLIYWTVFYLEVEGVTPIKKEPV